MNKEILRAQLITKLEQDYALYMKAAKSAHDAATHEENIPDNKYDTLALEASYVAQGQANRAQEIKSAIQTLKQMSLISFGTDDPARLSALVELETEDGTTRLIFIAPVGGGMSMQQEGREIRVVTPESPLGKAILGSQEGDLIHLTNDSREFEIISVS